MDQNGVIYALDIGDSYMRSGVYMDGVTRQVAVVPTPRALRGESGEARLMAQIVEMVAQTASEAPPMQALALAASGIMTLKPRPGARTYGPFKDHDLYVLAPNVDGLKYMPIQLRLEEMGWGVPIHVENDVNAATRSATEIDDAICINLGAGLGAAVKRGGRIEHVRGTWSCYEIGHGIRWKFPEQLTRRCHCGNIGCLEAIVGGWAMTERYRARPEDAPPETYDRMRNDVVSYLPQAIADTVRDSGLTTVLMAGRGAVGYSRDSEFLDRVKTSVEALLPSTPVSLGLLELGEIAELHGVVLALHDNRVLEGWNGDQPGKVK